MHKIYAASAVLGIRRHWHLDLNTSAIGLIFGAFGVVVGLLIGSNRR